MYIKYGGIDLREIKCCDPSTTTNEAGISFDEAEGYPTLRFHFLEELKLDTGKKIITSTEKIMYLDKKNINQLIERLKSLL